MLWLPIWVLGKHETRGKHITREKQKHPDGIIKCACVCVCVFVCISKQNYALRFRKHFIWPRPLLFQAYLHLLERGSLQLHWCAPFVSCAVVTRFYPHNAALLRFHNSPCLWLFVPNRPANCNSSIPNFFDSIPEQQNQLFVARFIQIKGTRSTHKHTHIHSKTHIQIVLSAWKPQTAQLITLPFPLSNRNILMRMTRDTTLSLNRESANFNRTWFCFPFHL